MVRSVGPRKRDGDEKDETKEGFVTMYVDGVEGGKGVPCSSGSSERVTLRINFMAGTLVRTN